MKGRRKVRTDKWQIMEQIIKEARAILSNRAVTSRRFLDVAAQGTLEEPIGLLAGCREVLAGSLLDTDKRKGASSWTGRSSDAYPRCIFSSPEQLLRRKHPRHT